MTTTENKVKFGLKNVHYAVATVADDGTYTYAAPVSIPGAVTMSLKHDGDTEPFEADDCDYYDLNNDNGYKGDFEFARIPDSFRTDCMGDVKDSNGLIVENSNSEIKKFALMYEIKGDKTGTKFVNYSCTASRPDSEAKTVGEKKALDTDKLTIASKPRPDGAVRSYTTADTPAAVSDAWYTKVQEPNQAKATTTTSSTTTEGK